MVRLWWACKLAWARRTDEDRAQGLVRPRQAVQGQPVHGAVAVVHQLLQRRVVRQQALLNGVLRQINAAMGELTTQTPGCVHTTSHSSCAPRVIVKLVRAGHDNIKHVQRDDAGCQLGRRLQFAQHGRRGAEVNLPDQQAACAVLHCAVGVAAFQLRPAHEQRCYCCPTAPRCNICCYTCCDTGQGGELLLACACLMCASLSSHGMWLGATSPSRPSPCRRAEWPSTRLADAGLSGAATAAVTSRRLLSASRASLRCRGGCHAACCAGHLARPGPPPALKLVEAWLCDSSLPSIVIEISAQVLLYHTKSSNYQIL